VKSDRLELQLELRDGVLGISSPAGGVRLDDDVAEGLLERVAVLPRSAPVRLRVALISADVERQRIPAVIHHHYAVLRERAEYRLERAMRAGRVSLIVGTVVLLAALGLAEALSRMTSGSLSSVAQEGLTIVGWVALWRPLDLLLFERLALRREIALYRRLEQMEIEL
jgi:hypothetical protein